MRKNDSYLHRIVVLFGFILPVIPIVLFIIFYYLPSKYEPYVMSLNGRWTAYYSNDTKTIDLSAVFESRGIRTYAIMLELS